MEGISAFFPCYNEAYSVEKIVKSADSTLRKLTSNYEIIIVDDGSTDKTRRIFKSLKQKYGKLKIVAHKKNKGYGAALQTGFRTASKELVFYTDCDGQYDVSELSILFGLLTPDVNFVNGIKMEREDSFLRVILGKIYNFLVRWVFWLPIFDTDCDFRLIRKSLLKRIKLNSQNAAICVELIKKAQREGAVFRQVSVHHYPRSYGKSRFFRPFNLLKTAKELTLLWIELFLHF